MTMSGPELRAALLALGLSQSQFAALTGNARQTISSRLNGDPRYPPKRSDETIIRLARGESLAALLRDIS